MKNIYQKLIVIQEHISGLGKDKEAFGYKYVTGDKILKLIKPIMNEQKLMLKQEIISIDNERQDYDAKNGKKSEILSKVMMKFTWIDCETGESDVNLFGANGQNGWDKGVGSALTYAERYFLLKYFHIATDEDDIDQPVSEEEIPAVVVDLTKCKSLQDLKAKFEGLSPAEKKRLEGVKNEMKNKLKK